MCKMMPSVIRRLMRQRPEWPHGRCFALRGTSTTWAHRRCLDTNVLRVVGGDADTLRVEFGSGPGSRRVDVTVGTLARLVFDSEEV